MAYFGRIVEVALYEAFLARAAIWFSFDAGHLIEAFQEACGFGLSAMDAVHTVLASLASCEEFITSERPEQSIDRTQRVRVVSIDPYWRPSCDNKDRCTASQLVIVLSSVAFAQTAPDTDVVLAAKSPITLARYVESHPIVDWKHLRSALGVKESPYWIAPCGSDFPAAESGCSAEIVTLANPGQAILIIRGGDFSYTVEYLRYCQDSMGAWRFTGGYSASKRNGPSHHEVMRFGGKPFLKVSSNRDQAGGAIVQQLEEWFDLTQPDFEPVFSFTPDGSEGRFGLGVSRSIHARTSLSQASGVERIDLFLDVHFEGIGLDLEAACAGIYERTSNATKFTLRIAYSGLARRTTIPTEDFAELADPFEGPSNEKLLIYALPGLQKIATGSDPAAKTWLESILESAEDTAEKRSLMEMLAKH